MSSTEQPRYTIPEEAWNRAHTQRTEIGPMMHVAAMAIYDQLDEATQDPYWWINLPESFERERLRGLESFGDLKTVAEGVETVAESLTRDYVATDQAPHMGELIDQNRRSGLDTDGPRALVYFNYWANRQEVTENGAPPIPCDAVYEGIMTWIVMPIQAYIALQAQRRFGTSLLKSTDGHNWRKYSLGASKLNSEHMRKTLSSDWFTDGLEALAAGRNGSLGRTSSNTDVIGHLPLALDGRPWLLRHGRHPIVNPEVVEQLRKTMVESRNLEDEPLAGSSGCPVRYQRFPKIGDVALVQLADWGIDPETLRSRHQTPIARASHLIGRIIDDVFSGRTPLQPTDQAAKTPVADTRPD